MSREADPTSNIVDQIDGQQSAIDQATFRVVNAINGHAIVERLVELAKSNGISMEPTDDHPVHVGSNRLALSEADTQARKSIIKPWMEEAGMDVFEHPLADIGVYQGEDPTQPLVMILSHVDTVPNGDIYDGTLGVIGGIEVVRVMKEHGVRPPRGIMVVSLTGEESAAYNIALFGSRAAFHGLSDSELNSSNNDGQTIAEALGEQNSEAAKTPIFNKEGGTMDPPYAAVELHVEQDTKLEDANVDVGVVEAVAAPERYRVNIGDRSLEPDTASYKYEKYFKVTVNGKANHSGATPMGEAHRADGLVATAEFLTDWIVSPDSEDVPESVRLGAIRVHEGSMNKVPGVTESMIRVASDDQLAYGLALHCFFNSVKRFNKHYSGDQNIFDEQPLELVEIDKEQAGLFFVSPELRRRQSTALQLIKSVNEVANEYSASNVVGTIGTYEMTEDGKIELLADIRGISLDSRDEAVAAMKLKSFKAAEASLAFDEPLPGSGAPVQLDARLVDKAVDVIDRFEVGTSQVMHSAASHDIQNVARAGIPAVLLFAQSNNGGEAHNPDAYTNPDNIGIGVRSLAALVMELAHEPDA